MANISLSNEEVSIVRHALQSYLSELRDEVHHTDNYDMREQLKQEERVLNRIIESLGQAAA